jgi:hypothetical protein
MFVRDHDAEADRRPRCREEGDAGQVAQTAASLISARFGLRIIVG